MTSDVHPLVAWLRDVHDNALRNAADIHDIEICDYADNRGRTCCCHWPDAIRDRVRAERGLLAMHAPYQDWLGRQVCRTCLIKDMRQYRDDWEDMPHPCPVWAWIAAGWSSWPGYRSEWRPDAVPNSDDEETER